jgi:mRNA interferase RelE/StbE
MRREGGAALSNFRIFETNEFLKQLGKLPSRESVFLRKKLEEYVYPQLRREPFWGKNVRKLQGYSPLVWRYRIGNFRIFYAVEKEQRVVSILTVDLRKDAYRL